MARTVLLGVAVACLLAGGTAQAASCPSDNPRSVADAVRGVFTAMQAHDDAAVKAAFTTDFYAFDGGRRFDGSALPKLIADALAAGKTYVWSVNDPDVHIACDHAWIAYVNKGSLTDARGTAPLTWLESAMLRFEGGRWRIEFLHSTRVAPRPHQQPRRRPRALSGLDRRRKAIAAPSNIRVARRFDHP